MAINETPVEAEIQAKNLYVFPGTPLTVCALKLKNGFIATGESAPASPENFDADLGRKIARDNARSKIWALEGYLLRSQLSAI
ncbi:MAG TPA: Gp49 family protein [Candidatus Acidoferrales bacterium]|nr:Gp49 family protein [Candidatus Acidoferrales bacterium]